jgi:hypothetical protein
MPAQLVHKCHRSEIDANFSSSFGNTYIADNNTNDSTINIVDKYGWLNVILLTPPDPSSVVQDTTFWINATITCEGPLGAQCGNIDGTVRYNLSSEADTPINETTGAAPFYIIGGQNQLSCPTDLNQSDSCQLNWTVNATGALLSTYEIDANFSSSFGSGNVPDNNTNDSTMQISGIYGWLDVSLILPVDSTEWVANKTYYVNATVTCQGPIGAQCGGVAGSVRYNSSFATPDTLINNTLNAKPFYHIGGSNPYNCLSTLNKGDICQLNWTINVTGDPGSSYEIDVNFSSDLGSSNVPDNETTKSTVSIFDKYGWLNVTLVAPSDYFDWVQNKTYWVNATVTCEGPEKAECGNVDGAVMYNASGPGPDTLINTISGVLPFHIILGTADYNFSSITSPTSTHKGEFGTSSSLPCSTLDCTSLTELSDSYAGPDSGGNYSGIVLPNDASEASYAQDGNNIYSLQRFRFIISEDEDDISELNISWRGYGAYRPDDPQAAYGVDLYVWDPTGWILVGSHSTSGPDWINASYSADIGKFINDTNGYLYLLAVATSPASPKTTRIATDYVDVTLGLYQNPRTCPSALYQSDSCEINWPVNITGATNYYEIDTNFSSSFGNSLVPDSNTADSTIHILTPTWDSYSDNCITQEDLFEPSGTVYACGDGFTPGKNYTVTIYRADNTQECNFDNIQADINGQIGASPPVFCSNLDDVQGFWHSQAFVLYGSPISYDANDPDEIIEDLSVTAQQAAFEVKVPEFAFVLIPLIFSGTIYLSFRRRFLEK